MSRSPDRRGLAAALATFLLWGLFPLYWYLLRGIPADQTVAHRVVWCAVLVVPLLIWREGFGWLRHALSQPRALPILLCSSVLISVNWGLYIWGVTHQRVIETSLGYYINPLVNVLFGVALLRERLGRVQWSAVALAAAGVAYMTWQLGATPWIALALAFSFGAYGLLRKVVGVGALGGLGVETLLVLPFALGWLLWVELQGKGAFGHVPPAQDALLAFGGVITALPLVGFAYAVRRLPYSTVGLLQYLAPTLQFLCGLLFFRESFSQDRLIGFVMIWVALAIYAAESVWRARRIAALPEADCPSA